MGAHPIANYMGLGLQSPSGPNVETRSAVSEAKLKDGKVSGHNAHSDRFAK